MGRKTLAKQKRKIDAVFKVAGDKSLKAKGRAKPVHFKSFKTRDKVEASDKQLDAIRELVSQPVKHGHSDRVVQEETSNKPEQQSTKEMTTTVKDVTTGLRKRVKINS